MSSSPLVSIIIVSHNTKELLRNTLASVFSDNTLPAVDVIVVENQSKDGSVEVIAKEYPRVRIVQTSALLGFSAANNLGAKHAKGSYLLFLNPDVEVARGSISILIKRMQTENLKVATAQLLNPDGTIQPQGGALPKLFNIACWMLFLDDIPVLGASIPSYQQRNPAYFQTFRSDLGWIGGTLFCISASTFKKVGGWDDRIFLYGEDVELCIRLHKMDIRIAHIPEAKAVHIGHGSTGSSKRSLVGEMTGLVYIWKKHYPRWQLPVLKSFLLLGSWMRLLVFGILLGDHDKRSAYIEASRLIFLA